MEWLLPCKSCPSKPIIALAENASHFFILAKGDLTKMKQCAIVRSEMDKAKVIGQRLRHARLDSNIKLRELARNLNIPSATLHRIETGKTTRPNIIDVYAITLALGIGMDELLRDDNPNPPEKPRSGFLPCYLTYHIVTRIKSLISILRPR